MARKFLNGIDAASQRITNVASGTQPTDAINLSQLQNALAGLSWHGAVRAASTGNVTVSSPGTTLDGVTLAIGNRILLKNQTAGAENGVWVFNGSTSPLTRAVDGAQNNLNAGAAFYVDEGTTLADSAWTLTTDDAITVGTTALVFARFGGTGSAYTAGTGLTLTGSQFAIDTTVTARRFSTNVGDGSSTSITVPHNFGTRDVIVSVRDNTTYERIEADDVATTVNATTLSFASAPASGAYRATVMG